MLDADLSGAVDRQELEKWLTEPVAPHAAQGQHPHYYAGKEKEKLRMKKAQSRADHDPSKATKATLAKHKLLTGLIEKRQREKSEDGFGFATAYVKRAFAQMDGDQSGKLDKEEIRRTFGNEYGVGLCIGMKEDEIDAFAEMADLDGDGEISYNELIRSMDIHETEAEYVVCIRTTTTTAAAAAATSYATYTTYTSSPPHILHHHHHHHHHHHRRRRRCRRRHHHRHRRRHRHHQQQHHHHHHHRHHHHHHHDARPLTDTPYRLRQV